MSSSRFSRPLFALLAVPLFAACGYGDHPYRHGQGGYNSSSQPTPQGNIEQAAIDTDQTLDVAAGAGAGAFIEYASGGLYTIKTSCDTAQGSSCYWDIVVTPLDNAALQSASPIALESDDSLTFGANSHLRLVAYTG